MPTMVNRADRSTRVKIETEGDIVSVRKAARVAAQNMGFGVTDVTRIVTAASELARNIYKFADKGIMTLSLENSPLRKGMTLVFEDIGPGIEDIGMAMQENYTTGDGLGLGLPGTKRLMDHMEIASEPGRGTKITISKWLDNGGRYMDQRE